MSWIMQAIRLLPGHELARLHRPGIHPPSLADLDYELSLGVDDLSEV